MTPTPTVLCVDDEPLVLEALERNLDDQFQVHTATSGDAGLALLRDLPDAAVVVSDMRMPGMDGASFLAEVHRRAPLAARILLTGQSDLQDAARAVNQGGLFRFLIKPCPPDELRRALAAGVTHWTVQRAERDLLERTVNGTIQLLLDVLQLTAASTFRTSATAKRFAADLAARLELPEPWRVEAAALLAPLGLVTLPEDLSERGRTRGRRMTNAENDQFRGHPQAAQRLLERVPRLESVARLVGQQLARGAPKEPTDPDDIAAAVVRVSILAAELVHDGVRRSELPTVLAGRLFGWDKVLARSLDLGLLGDTGIELTLRVDQLKPGMVLLQDARSSSGTLLANTGLEVTHAMIERLVRFRSGVGVAEPLKVRVQDDSPPPGPDASPRRPHDVR